MIDDRELLRALAQACGYSVEPAQWSKIDGYGMFHIHTVTDGFGNVSTIKEMIQFGVTVDDAYDHALKHFPDWLHSVDAALSLPWEKMDTHLELFVWPDEAVVNFIDTKGKQHTAIAPTLARALCECFYQWATAQKEAGK